METGNIQDFSDLAESTQFKYKNATFSIPPFTRKSMTELLRVNQKISAHVNKPKENFGGEENTLTDADVTGMDELFSMQQEFITLAVYKVIDGGKLIPLVKDDVEEWPMRLQARVISLINKALAHVSEREDERPT